MEDLSLTLKYPNLVVAFSERKDGSMRFGDVSSKNVRNRKRFLKKLKIKPNQVVGAKLVHGNRVGVVSKKDSGTIIPETDGLVTDKKNLFLVATFADCLPIFVFDPKQEVVGLIHGGRKGLAKAILRVAIQKMNRVFNVNPKNLKVGIGPGICREHYEVGEEALKSFKHLPQSYNKRNGKVFLDLRKVAFLQLTKLGIKKKNIEISAECTYELSEKYFSYRRDKALKTMLAVIGMRS